MSNIVRRFGVDIDLSTEGKTACPRCVSKGKDRSGNNFHVYGLDSLGRHKGGFCWSCNFPILSVEHMEESGFTYEYTEEDDVMGREFNREIYDKLRGLTGTDPRNYRGISKEASHFFSVRYEYNPDTGKVARTLYPTTRDYKMVGYKVRAAPKDFQFPGPMGETGKDCELFGQVKFKTHNGMCLITGGEHDAIAAYQILSGMKRDQNYDTVAVVSPTIGESAAFKQAALQYEWFTQFKRIIICMDSDEAGQKAAEELADVLPQGKVFVMTMRRKDPNAYLWDKETDQVVNHSQEFIRDFWAMKPYTPVGVKSASEAFDEIKEELLRPRITLPPYMHVMQEMMGGGIIQGRVANIIADTSTGKSTHVNRIVDHLVFNSPETPTIISLEATAGQYMLEMVGIYMQKNLRWSMGELEIIDFLETEEGQRIKNHLCFKEDGSPRFYLIDTRKGTIKDLEAQMEKMRQKHGSKLFVIDVLSDLLRGSSEDLAEDHMNFQRNLNKEGVTVINVLHTRKPPQSADGKPRKVTEYDALGTGSFVQSAAYNIVLNREKLAEDVLLKNTTEVDLPKCRGGKTGSAGRWYYDFMTATCHDLGDYLRDHPELMKF